MEVSYGSTRPGQRVNVTNWKDPPCYEWLNPLFRLGHVQKQTVSLPEGNPSRHHGCFNKNKS